VFGIGNDPSSKDGVGNHIGVQVAALPPFLERCWNWQTGFAGNEAG